MDLAVAVVGAVVLVGGLSVAFLGYDQYLAQKEINETIQQQAEEMGLAEIPGVNGDPEYGLAVMITGIAVAVSGGGLLVFGSTRTCVSQQTGNRPLAGAESHILCENCSEESADDADLRPRCGMEKRP